MLGHQHRHWALRVGPPAALLMAFWLFYVLSIQAVRALGGEVQAAVDLYRLKLLDALEIERPKTLDEEHRVWTDVRRFIAEAECSTPNVRLKVKREQAGSREGEAGITLKVKVYKGGEARLMNPSRTACAG